MKTHETMREHAAPQVFVKRLLHVARQRFFVSIARMAQKRAEVLPYEVVEDCRLGATRFLLRAREAERRPRPRRRITAICLRLVSPRTSTAARHGADCASHGSCHFRYLEPAILADRGFRHGAARSGGPGGRPGSTIAVSVGPEATSGARARASSGGRSPARLPGRSAAERAPSAQCASNHRPIISYASRPASRSPAAAADVICSGSAASSATRGGSGAPSPTPSPWRPGWAILGPTVSPGPPAPGTR